MEDFADLLRRKGLRNTAQRRAVLTALGRSPHATAPDLEQRIGIGRAVSPSGSSPEPAPGPVPGPVVRAPAGLSRQGLYNVLDDLTRAGLVRRIEPAGSPARYELRVGDNHHHLVCRECGRVEDVDCAVGKAPCLEPADDRGFVIDEAEITWWGLCGPCGARRAAGRPAADG